MAVTTVIELEMICISTIDRTLYLAG